MNTRLHHLRKTLKLSQEDFGKRLGVTGASISRLEKGERNITEQMILSICREFNVNEKWLRHNEGEMFLPFEDEVAEMVSQLLEVSNPFYDLILDMMVSFNELDDKGKQVICDYTALLAERMAKRKKEDD
jgi:transcriptional regulator with XRE-family HTH domain